MRTPSVIAAETRLGKWNGDAEEFFKNQSSHTATNLSDIFSDQKLSVSVCATPKGGAHRVDTFAGSLKVSDSIYTGDFSDTQKDQILKNGTKNTQDAYEEFKKNFGKQFANVSSADYTSYLKTRNLTESMKGLTVTQGPIFFEARAMVHGNLCSNKVEGIGYPRFSYQGKSDLPPPFSPPVEDMPLEYGSGSTGTPGVQSRTSQKEFGA